jgi:hypothetical protein
MHDVEVRRMLTNDRIETLRRAAAQPVRPSAHARREETAEIELRLCRAADDPALDVLGELAERPVPDGRLVLAFVEGRLVAALPLAGGRPITDPFTRTAHLIGLLELRAKQLRQPALRPGSFRLLRRHA